MRAGGRRDQARPPPGAAARLEDAAVERTAARYAALAVALVAASYAGLWALTGWAWRRRDFGGLVFVDLRDREGLTQVLFDPDVAPEAFKTAEGIRPEWPVCITGTVQHRSEGQTNESLATGEIEILASEIEVLNTAQTPPFQIENHIDVNEDLRLRYRYVDLRRPRMARNLRLRSDFTFSF